MKEVAEITVRVIADSVDGKHALNLEVEVKDMPYGITKDELAKLPDQRQTVLLIANRLGNLAGDNFKEIVEDLPLPITHQIYDTRLIKGDKQ